MLEVQVKEVEAMTVISLSFTGPYDQTQDKLEELMSSLLRAGHPFSQTPLALYYDDPAKVEADKLRAEVCLPIGEEYAPSDEGKRKELPGASVAYAVHQGPYREIPPVYESIFAWIGANGYRYVEGTPTREVFLKIYGEAEDPKDFVTEIQVPVEKA
jgi:effector-binding domain-containing protein